MSKKVRHFKLHNNTCPFREFSKEEEKRVKNDFKKLTIDLKKIEKDLLQIEKNLKTIKQ